MTNNVLYAQSGGVTAVINATACGLIETAREHGLCSIYAGLNGIIGVLQEDLIDIAHESPQVIKGLMHTPGGAFGSCRYKLQPYESDPKQYQRLIEVFKAHKIKYFFYNGGGDSQDTTNKIAKISRRLGYPITCIGIPKTIDNDLPITDCCPGYGSVAKYVAISIQEAALDVASMAKSSTKVFIFEVMGRHTGWIAAAAGLGKNSFNKSPHLILFPEIPFNRNIFCKQVKQCVEKFGFCTIVAAEGILSDEGKLIAESGLTDAFGHAQLGGLAPILAQIVKSNLGYKYHWAVADYLQRSARHIASQTDLDQAYALGKAAIEMAIAGKNAIMPTIIRENNNPYKWSIGETALDKVANIEKKMPRSFITADGFGITDECREYIAPLIQGEAYPPYKNGLPIYQSLKQKVLVEKKLPEFNL